MRAFEIGLQDDPKVASSICYAISCLAENADVGNDDKSVLSPYLFGLLSFLLKAVSRPDSIGANNLLTSAYEAMTTLINNSSDDTAATVYTLLPVMIERLQASFMVAPNSDASAELIMKQAQIQGLICSVLQVFY